MYNLKLYVNRRSYIHQSTYRRFDRQHFIQWHFVRNTISCQNVWATKCIVIKKPWRQNDDTKKSNDYAKKCIHPRNKEKVYFLATRIAIEKCFYWKVSAGTNRIPIGDLPVFFAVHLATVNLLLSFQKSLFDVVYFISTTK